MPDNHQPTLVLNRSITLQGIYPAPAGATPDDSQVAFVTNAEPFWGMIETYAFSFAPHGSALTNGLLLAINQNTGLFSLLGTTFGGNGQTNFALPDLRGRVSLDTDSGSGPYFLGQVSGSEPVPSVTQANLPTALGGSATPLSDLEPNETTFFFIGSSGQIIQAAFSFAPQGYLPCDGRTLSTADYPNLFSVIGTIYGGNGVTTFVIPDLRGRIVVGASAQHEIGSTFGSNDVTITQANLPVSMGGSGTPIDNHQASIALNFLIANSGFFPSQNLITTPVYGEIIMFAGTIAPAGYEFARGQLLNIGNNVPLFQLIGTTYGGDGQTNFALPDLRDRAIEGMGQGPGLADHQIGEQLGADTFTLSLSDIPALTIIASDSGGTLYGGTANDHITGGAGVDFFHLENGGADTVGGGGGNDAFFFGAAFTAADTVDGGAGSNDQIGLQGDYSGGLTLGAGTITGVEVIAVLPGFDYSLTTVDANVPAGGLLTIFGGNLGVGDNLTFNGAAETNGAFRTFGGLGTENLTGGAGDDGFYFGSGKFGASDVVNGGGGTNDQLGLDGNYTLTLGGNITNIEVLALMQDPARPHNSYNISTNDAFVAAGQTMTIYAVQVINPMTFNGSAESNGAFRVYGGEGADTITTGQGADWIHGGLGADTITGGAGADTLAYESANQSTSTGFDNLVGFSFAADQLDLPGTHDEYLYDTAGRLDAATFDADLAANLAALTTGRAIFFTPDSGSYAGQTFLIVDGDGVAGYQAGSDYVFHFDVAAPAGPPPDFIV